MHSSIHPSLHPSIHPSIPPSIHPSGQICAGEASIFRHAANLLHNNSLLPISSPLFSRRQHSNVGRIPKSLRNTEHASDNDAWSLTGCFCMSKWFQYLPFEVFDTRNPASEPASQPASQQKTSKNNAKTTEQTYGADLPTSLTDGFCEP